MNEQGFMCLLFGFDPKSFPWAKTQEATYSQRLPKVKASIVEHVH